MLCQSGARKRGRENGRGAKEVKEVEAERDRTREGESASGEVSCLRQIFVLLFEQRLTVNLVDAVSNLCRVIIARCQHLAPPFC